MVYTNVDINNMIDELRKHLKNVTNKDYIKKCINYHYDFELITLDEKNILEKDFLESGVE